MKNKGIVFSKRKGAEGEVAGLPPSLSFLLQNGGGKMYQDEEYQDKEKVDLFELNESVFRLKGCIDGLVEKGRLTKEEGEDLKEAFEKAFLYQGEIEE